VAPSAPAAGAAAPASARDPERRAVLALALGAAHRARGGLVMQASHERCCVLRWDALRPASSCTTRSPPSGDNLNTPPPPPHTHTLNPCPALLSLRLQVTRPPHNS
jgi:hypothetical protein